MIKAVLNNFDKSPSLPFPISIAKNLETLFDKVLFRNIIKTISVPMSENIPKSEIPSSLSTHLLLNNVNTTDINVLAYDTTVFIRILFDDFIYSLYVSMSVKM